MRKISKIFILSLASVFIFMACSSFTAPGSRMVKTVSINDEEVKVIAQTLAGECYDDKLADKRNVAKVIVNRVSDGGFGGNVIEIVTAPGQFYGYWNQSRPVSESDIQIAEEILNDWYANDCKALSEHLFFCAGSNRENVFRKEIKP